MCLTLLPFPFPSAHALVGGCPGPVDGPRWASPGPIPLFPLCGSLGEVAGAGVASIMSTLTEKAIVKKELLYDVVGRDKYQVNNKHDDKYSPLPPSKIVQRAEGLVGQELPYSLPCENCEHFVNELRYGVPRSDQVRPQPVSPSPGTRPFRLLAVAGHQAPRRQTDVTLGVGTRVWRRAGRRHGPARLCAMARDLSHRQGRILCSE